MIEWRKSPDKYLMRFCLSSSGQVFDVKDEYVSCQFQGSSSGQNMLSA